MLTRCPNCDTTFRVTPEQLKARHGKVRCGECQEVFNALDTLVETAPAVGSAPGSMEPAVAHELEFEVPGAEEPIPEEDVGPVAEEADRIDAPVVELPPEPEPQPAALEEDNPADPATPGDWLTSPDATKPRRRWPWLLGSAVALFVLAFQVLMHFRSEIPVLQPGMAAAVTNACEVLGCEMRLPRKAELMSIETSDLHPEAGGKLTLTASLKNRAPFAQEHAHLELTLTDTADKALVRRVLAPAEYLAAAERAGGIAPGKELPIELSIDAPGVPAAGYRLYLFYP